MHRGSKRGFFFTVMALAILSFMLLTVQVWVRTFEQSDARHAERFKAEAMRTAFSSLSDKAISDFANASAFYAVFALSNYSSTHNGIPRESAQDPDNPHTGLVEKNLLSLMLNGTSTGGLAPGINYSDSEREAYTLSSWNQKVAQAANVMGLNASFSEPRNLRIRQTGPWEVSVGFEIDVNISDLEGTMRQSKSLSANSSFSLDGFDDPSIKRSYLEFHQGIASESAVEKQAFRNINYNSPSDVKPGKSNASGGSGWFFGPITESYPDEMAASEIGRLSQYVLAHRYDEKLLGYAPLYGAVIVTNPPGTDRWNITDGGCTYDVYQETTCLNCKKTYVAREEGCRAIPPEYSNIVDRPMLSGISIPSLANVYLGDRTERHVLIDNSHERYYEVTAGDYHRLWDITALRDMAICGFYVHEPSAPSFFQRMLPNSYETGVNSSAYGIESFVVGKWAGGADDYSGANSAHPSYSKLDREFFKRVSVDTYRIKGMMGCKSKSMCTPVPGGNNATKDGVGVFRLSRAALLRYGLDKIACGFGTESASPCE